MKIFAIAFVAGILAWFVMECINSLPLNTYATLPKRMRKRKEFEERWRNRFQKLKSILKLRK